MYGLGIEFAAEGFGRRGSVVFLACRLFGASGCRPGGLLTEVVAGLNYLGRYTTWDSTRLYGLKVLGCGSPAGKHFSGFHLRARRAPNPLHTPVWRTRSNVET